MRARIGFLQLAWAVAAAGCVTNSPEEDWGELPSSLSRARDPTLRVEAGKALSAWARGFRTADQCERAARRYANHGDHENALLHLYACLGRPDFDLLPQITRAPWQPLLRRDGERGLRMLGQVLSRRDEINVDVQFLQLAQFDVHSLEDSDKEDLTGERVLAPVVVNQAGMIVIADHLGYDTPKFAQSIGYQYRRTTLFGYDAYGNLMAAATVYSVRPDSAPNHSMSFSGRKVRFGRTERCPTSKGQAVLLLARVRGERGVEHIDLEVEHCYALGLQPVDETLQSQP